MSDEKEMSFLEHLESLRWHVLRAVASIFVFGVVAFIYKDFFLGKIVLGMTKPDFLTYRLLCQLSEATCIDKLNFKLISITMTGQFMMHMTYSIVTGFILSFPYVFWEIWRFIKPALHDIEQSAANDYQLDPSIENQIDIASYVSTVVMLVLACGLMFQLPVAVYVLSKIGLLTPTMMRTYRRHAIMTILIISAFITPSPDVISQLLVALPVYFLYEGSVFISAYVWKKQTAVLNSF
jgi:sec-independent protein translocase protein TatC